MTPNELAASCVKAINATTGMGLPMAQANIPITTPKGWKAPPKFPRGEIVQVKEDGTSIRYVSAMNVLAWMTANGMVKLESSQ